MTRLRTDESGTALILALAFAGIIALYALMVFATLQTSQQGARTTRNVTSARAAADAGAEDIIFDLGVSGSSNTPWDTYVSSYDDPLQAYEDGVTEPKLHVKDLGDARFYVTVTEDSFDARARLIHAVGEYPAGTGDHSRLTVTVRKDAPQAFQYAMFADSDITIHHHGTILSPLMVTPRVHSNGSITLPASSEMNVDTVTAVGTVTLKEGGGKTKDHPNLSSNATSGSYGTEGYTWRYDIGPHNRCYPTWNPNTTSADFGDVSEPETPYSSHAGNGCDRRWFAGSGTVVGDILAHSVDVQGTVKSAGARLTEAMVEMQAKDGNVFVSQTGQARIGGQTVTGSSGDVISCANCGKSSGANGTISGKVHIVEQGPQAIEYPSIDYESTYRPRAQRQQDNACLPGEPCNLLDGGKKHVFSGSGEWLDYITDPANGFYRYIKDGGEHAVWPKNSGFGPDYILLRGDWYVEGGVSLSSSDVNKAVASKLNVFDEDDPTMPIVIGGTLVSPDGGMSMKGRLYMVGRGNHTDFLEPDPSSDYDGDGDLDDVRVNRCRFLNRADGTSGSSTCGDDLGPMSGFSEVEPGVLAGTKMDASDGDTDSPWESDGDYEPSEVNATWVRGLVYAGEWDEGEQRSEPGDHHWHNQDPKNSVRIFGSQIGGKLHDCNNFEFTYDSVVLKAFGFGGGTGEMVVVSWDED